MKGTVEEARAKRVDMEKRLADIVKVFERDTGCTVVTLTVKRDLDQFWYIEAKVQL